MSEELNAVEPSAAVTAVADGWDETGTPIVTKKPDPPKSSPSKQDVSATSEPADETLGKKAESGTAKEKPVDKRIKQLLDERKEERERLAKLETELAEFRKGAKPAETKPTPEAQKAAEPPKRPRMAEFLNVNGTLDSEKYEAAMDKYETDKEAFREHENRVKNASAEQGRMIDKWKSDLKGKYSEKADGIDVKTTVDKLVSTVKDAPAFAAFVNDSEVFTDLLYVLGTDPKLDEFLELAKTNPTKAIRKLIALEAGVQAELSKETKAPAVEPPKAEKKPEEPKPRAPKPPPEVGGRGASTEDAGVSAAKDGNFSAFDIEQKRRYMRASQP